MIKIEDEAIVLQIRQYNESGILVKLFTKNHGICSAFTKKSKNNNLCLQIGNIIDIHMSTRVEGQLYKLNCELQESLFGHIINDRVKLTAITSILELITILMPEHETHINFYNSLLNFISIIKQSNWHKTYILLEQELLKISGFGLALQECGETGIKDNLIYVSPKTGRAISKQIGLPYDHKLLKLPEFMVNDNIEITKKTFNQALYLNRFFFENHLFKSINKRMPDSRAKLDEVSNY
jgi:DNA repair protein RecO (recombination protein O)